MVLIRLMAPPKRKFRLHAVAANAVTDQTGHFRAEFVFLTESRWDGQSSALVIAQTSEVEMTGRD
ncbi:MAG: hypothetical protein U0401_12620 [Anaerolineae bacterium]